MSEGHYAGIADFNGDGYPDIFLLGHASSGKIYFNDGSGVFIDSQQNIGIGTEYPEMLIMGTVQCEVLTERNWRAYHYFLNCIISSPSPNYSTRLSQMNIKRSRHGWQNYEINYTRKWPITVMSLLKRLNNAGRFGRK